MEIDISRWMLRAVDKSRKNERKKKNKKTRLSGSLLWLYRRHIGEFLASILLYRLGLAAAILAPLTVLDTFLTREASRVDRYTI